MLDPKILTMSVVIGSCLAVGVFMKTSQSTTNNAYGGEQSLDEMLASGKESGASMFTLLIGACTTDDAMMPSASLEVLCDEIGDAESMEELYISCPADTSTCISFSDFFSKMAYTLDSGTEDVSAEAFSEAIVADGNLLCEKVAAPCPSETGRRLNILHNNDRMLWSSATSMIDYIIDKFKGMVSNVNFGCCTENIKLDFNGDTARCAADVPTTEINPNKGECLSAARTAFPQTTSVTSGRKTLVVGKWGHVPPGCSVQSKGDWAVHYNRGGGCGSRDCSDKFSPVDQSGAMVPSKACGECRYDGMCKDAGKGDFTKDWSSLQGAKNFFDGGSHSNNMQCIDTNALHSGNFGEINKDVSHNCCYYHDYCLANSNQFADEGKAKYMCDVGIAACNGGRRAMVGLLAPRQIWKGLTLGSLWPVTLPENKWVCASLQQLMFNKGFQDGLTTTGDDVHCEDHAWAKKRLGL